MNHEIEQTSPPDSAGSESDRPDSERPELNRSKSLRKQSLLRVRLGRLTMIVAGVYLLILVTLAANETSLVYPGSKYPKGNWNPTDFDFEEVKFQSADGTKLVGWHLRAPQADLDDVTPTHRTILLCHGNGENVSESAGYMGEHFRQTLNAEVFAFDYRGFGKSEGSPDEAGVLADSEAALQWICEKSGRLPHQIILVGHSLGGGPAIHLAKNFGCQILILQRTYSSIKDVAQSQYPWLPVRYIMRNDFPSLQKIKHCDCPLFQSHGGNDRLIPIRFAERLFQASPSQHKKFVKYPTMGHFDPLPSSYWPDIHEFVSANECSGREREPLGR